MNSTDIGSEFLLWFFGNCESHKSDLPIVYCCKSAGSNPILKQANKYIVCMGKVTCLFFLCYQFCSLPKSDHSSKQNENVMWKGNWKFMSIRMIRDLNEQAILQFSYRYYGKSEERPLQLYLLLTYIINFPCIPGSQNSVKYCNNIGLLKKKGCLVNQLNSKSFLQIFLQYTYFTWLFLQIKMEKKIRHKGVGEHNP